MQQDEILNKLTNLENLIKKGQTEKPLTLNEAALQQAPDEPANLIEAVIHTSGQINDNCLTIDNLCSYISSLYSKSIGTGMQCTALPEIFY